MSNIVLKENEMLGEKHYGFTHKSGLEVFVFPKKMTTSYAIFATRYGAVDNKFKHVTDEEYTIVPDGIAHFLVPAPPLKSGQSHGGTHLLFGSDGI